MVGLLLITHNQIGTALLLTCPVVLLAAGLVASWDSRFYAPDIAALGTTATDMTGTRDTAT